MPLKVSRSILLVWSLLAGCGGSQRTTHPVVAPSADVSFQPSIVPFAVSDSLGRQLELAFLGGFNTPRPQLVDEDGDGDLDLFVQEVTGSVALFERSGERNGVPQFLFRTAKYGGLDIGEWYRFADVDQDGDLDLLAEQPYSYIKYYRNETQGPRGGGRPRFVLAADTLRDTDGRPIFSDRQNIPQLGDIDCNRRADLLIGRLDGTVARYEAEPSGDTGVPAFRLVASEFEGIRIIGQQTMPGPAMPGVFAPGPSMHGANTMALTDHDGDGDLDLFWGDFFEPGLLLIENQGTCAAPNLRGQPAQFPRGDPVLTTGYNAPTFGTIKGAQLELVLGVLGGAYNPLRSSADNLYYMQRGSSGQWVLRSKRLLPVLDVGSESIPAVVDIEQDGDLDLLLANKLDPSDPRSSRVYLLENVGSPRRAAFQLRRHLPLPPRFHYAPAVGDLDGDQRPDLVVGHWGPNLAWYSLRSGGVQAVDTALVTITRGSNTVPALGDLDADGDLDLMVGESSGWLNFYRNTGTRNRAQFSLVSDEFEGIKVGRRSAPALMDIEGDGDLDLLVGSELDGVLLVRNEGSKTVPRFARGSKLLPALPALAAPAGGDFDDDGDLDLVVGNVGGGLVYLRHSPCSIPPSDSF